MTAADARPLSPLAAVHEHGWATASRHRTSDGDIIYVRCVLCGMWRVDVDSPSAMPPEAQTRVVSAARR